MFLEADYTGNGITYANSNATGSLIINGTTTTPSATAVTPGNATATFGDSSVTLSAGVAVPNGTSGAGTPINEGFIEFDIVIPAGVAPIAAVDSTTVQNGQASVTVPVSNLPAGNYAIEATYLTTPHHPSLATARPLMRR